MLMIVKALWPTTLSRHTNPKAPLVAALDRILPQIFIQLAIMQIAHLLSDLTSLKVCV